MKTRLKNREDIEDFVYGGTLMGAGGSCLPDVAIGSLMDVLTAGHRLEWVDFSDLSPEGMVFSTANFGTTATRDVETYAQMKALALTEDTESLDMKAQITKAVQELQQVVDAPLVACVAPETSDSTNSATLIGAALNNCVAVDGSYMPRAIPAIDLTTFAMAARPIAPMAFCDGWGNVSVVKSAFNVHTAELLGKLISQAGFGLIGMAGMTIKTSELEDVLVPGTLSVCLQTGRALRAARTAGVESLQDVLKVTGAAEICSGPVTKIEAINQGGYYVGRFWVQDEGAEFCVWFKNENFVIWKDDVPVLTGPDIISAIDLDTILPVANQALRVDQRLCVVGLPFDSRLEGTAMVEAISPRAFGFEFDPVRLHERATKQQ